MYPKKSLSNQIFIFIAIAVVISASLACSTGSIVHTETEPTSQGEQGQNEPPKPPQEPTIQVPTNRPIPTSAPTPAPIGLSRNNPHPRSEVLSTPNWEVQVVETKRGEQAWQEIHAENMFNVAPPDGMEYILVKLHVKSISADNDEHSIGGCDFGVTGDRLINYNCGMVVIVEPEPRLDAKLYTGGEVEGWAGYLVTQGEKNLMLVVNETQYSDEDPVRYIALDEGASISISPDLASIMPTDLGMTRDAPAPRTEQVTTEDWELAVIEEVRGDEAWAMVLEASQYNDPPAEGMEYIAVKIHVRSIGTEEKAERIEGFSFSATGSKNILYDYKYVSEPYPSLSGISLYPGGEFEGWIVLQVAKGETGIILVFQSWLDFSGENRRYISLEP